VGGSAGSAGGTATLTVGDSGTVTVTGTAGLKVWGGGTLTGGGGTIVASAGGVTNLGTVAPGASAGLMNITGAYTQTTGTLQIELGGTTRGTQYDALLATGAMTLGGTLTVTTIGGFNPVMGNTFDILDWGSLSGTFATVNLPSLSGGLGWDTSNLYTTGEITVTPEASTLALFGVGLLGLLLVRRKRKREA
jgi:hypothetical protein